MSPDETAIRSLLDTWIAASKTGDLATILSLTSDDVVFMTPGREPFGKAAFANTSKAMSNVKIDGTSDIVELVILGDWAYMRCKLRITITAPNAPPATRSGYTLTILKKSPDGQWQITRDANLLAPDQKP